jgi:hypothetical protein
MADEARYRDRSGDRQCEVFRGTTETVIQNPDIPRYPSVPDVGIDFESAVGFPIEPDNVVVFAPAAGLFGGECDPGRLLRKPMTTGVIINCLADVWYVESEPTRGGRFGLLVRTGRGKTVMCGQGSVSSEEDGSISLNFDLETVYDHVSSSPRNDSVKVGGGTKTDPDGRTSWETRVDYTYNF